LIEAPDSDLICLILWPPLPMIDPANFKRNRNADDYWGILFGGRYFVKRVKGFSGLTSLGMVTCVVTTGPLMSP
jgi:hypothetical protein